MSAVALAVKPRLIGGQVVLWPADTYTRNWAAEAKTDALYWFAPKRPRSPKFHRAVHQLGKMLAENVDKFSRMDPHDVIKTLQLESRLHCKAMALDVPGFGRVMHLIPESISFDKMDETAFRALIDGLADYVRGAYWPEFSLDLLEAA